MTTGAQAIERIAEITGTAPATVHRAARTLREASHLLWPVAGKGGGKVAAHVEPHHLVNLALALTVDPITEAPQIVTGLRELVPDHTAPSVPLLSGETLGAALDNLVDALSTPSGAAPFNSAKLLSMQVDVRRYGNRRPFVFVRAIRNKIDGGENVFTVYEPPQAEMAAAATTLPAAPLNTTSTIPLKFFEIAADMWADTRAHAAASTGSAPTPASARTERTKAARTAIQSGLQLGQPAKRGASVQMHHTATAPVRATPLTRVDRSPNTGDRPHERDRAHAPPP